MVIPFWKSLEGRGTLTTDPQTPHRVCVDATTFQKPSSLAEWKTRAQSIRI